MGPQIKVFPPRPSPLSRNQVKVRQKELEDRETREG